MYINQERRNENKTQGFLRSKADGVGPVLFPRHSPFVEHWTERGKEKFKEDRGREDKAWPQARPNRASSVLIAVQSPHLHPPPPKSNLQKDSRNSREMNPQTNACFFLRARAINTNTNTNTNAKTEREGGKGSRDAYTEREREGEDADWRSWERLAVRNSVLLFFRCQMSTAESSVFHFLTVSLPHICPVCFCPCLLFFYSPFTLSSLAPDVWHVRHGWTRTVTVLAVSSYHLSPTCASRGIEKIDFQPLPVDKPNMIINGIRLVQKNNK